MEAQVAVEHVVLEHIVQEEQEVAQVVRVDIRVQRVQQRRINAI